VQQNDNGNACKVLPGAFLVVREIHACFLQYQLFLLLLNPKMATQNNSRIRDVGELYIRILDFT
jgi:hypothetical protein